MTDAVMHKRASQNNHLTFGEKPSTAFWQTIKKVYKNITVEPVIFFYGIGHGVTAIITQALYFDKICQVNIIGRHLSIIEDCI